MQQVIIMIDDLVAKEEMINCVAAGNIEKFIQESGLATKAQFNGLLEDTETGR